MHSCLPMIFQKTSKALRQYMSLDLRAVCLMCYRIEWKWFHVKRSRRIIYIPDKWVVYLMFSYKNLSSTVQVLNYATRGGQRCNLLYPRSVKEGREIRTEKWKMLMR